MQDESKIRQMNCTEFEALVTDALDGALLPPAEQRFQFHLNSCQLCRPLFEETKAGMGWLRSLEPVELPARLVHNILAQTSMQQATLPQAAGMAAAQGGWRERASLVLGNVIDAVWGTVRQPRFGMSFAMAFFSVSLLLNVAGIRITDLRKADLRPSAMASNARMTYYQTSGRAIKYFQDLRFVYELESKVRELKRVTGSDEAEQPAEKTQPKPEEQKQQKKDDNGLTERERKQNRNYSREVNGTLMAECIPPSDTQFTSEARSNETGLETRSLA